MNFDTKDGNICELAPPRGKHSSFHCKIVVIAQKQVWVCVTLSAKLFCHYLQSPHSLFMVRTLLSSLPRLHVVASTVLCSVFKFYLTIFTFLLFHLVLNLFPSPLLTLILTFPSCSVCYFLSHVIVLAAHNESGEIVVARSVKEEVKTEWLPDLRFSLSPHSLIQCMSAGFHTEQSFSFSPQYASVFFFIFCLSPPYVIFSYLFVFVPAPYCPCCCQFPDGRTWVVSPFRQRRKSQSSWPVSEKCVR